MEREFLWVTDGTFHLMLLNLADLCNYLKQSNLRLYLILESITAIKRTTQRLFYLRIKNVTTLTINYTLDCQFIKY